MAIAVARISPVARLTSPLFLAPSGYKFGLFEGLLYDPPRPPSHSPTTTTRSPRLALTRQPSAKSPLPHCSLFSQENLPILVEPNRHQIAEHGHAKERDEQHRVSRIQLGCYRAVARMVGPHISRPSRTIAYTSRSCLRSYEGRGARESPCSCGQSSFGLKQFVGVRAPSFQVASSSKPISRSTARHTRLRKWR